MSLPKPKHASSDAKVEEGECGFCLFMKAGGCRDAYTDWEQCVEKNGEMDIYKCVNVTKSLITCMHANSDYYKPILVAEKKALEQLKQEAHENKEDGPQGF